MFFFSSRRRHTRYIGDWSSDVCSSDLTQGRNQRTGANPMKLHIPRPIWLAFALVASSLASAQDHVPGRVLVKFSRSEERRVGKEWITAGLPVPLRKISMCMV